MTNTDKDLLKTPPSRGSTTQINSDNVIAKVGPTKNRPLLEELGITFSFVKSLIASLNG